MDIINTKQQENHIARSQIEQVQQKQNELQFIGSLKRVKGHTLFSYNRETGEIKPAEFERKVTLDFYGNPKYEERVIIERYCHYEQALNRKNFIKRLKRRGFTVDNQ